MMFSFSKKAVDKNIDLVEGKLLVFIYYVPHFPHNKPERNKEISAHSQKYCPFEKFAT